MDPEFARDASVARNLSVREIDLAVRLRARRLAAGLSRQDLADRAGVSERSIRDIENGKRPRVQDKTLMLLAEALGCEPGDLAVLPAVPPPAPAGEATFRSGGEKPRRVRWPLVTSLVGAVALLLIAAAVWFAIDRASWEIVDGDVVVRDAMLQHVLWRLDAGQTARLVVPSPWTRHRLLIGFNGNARDGAQAWLVDAATGKHLASYAMDDGPVREAFGDEILAEGQDFSCSDMRALDIDGDGTPELAIRFTHGKYYPVGVGCFTADGTRLGLYVNRGHLCDWRVEDLDQDGRDELLVLGTNNDPAYQGATIIWLEEGAWDGASVDPPGGPGDGPVGDIADGARYRLVLPAFTLPVMNELKVMRLDAFNVRTHRLADGALRIVFSVGVRSRAGVSVVCDDQLRPLMANPVDDAVSLARTWGPPYGEPGEFPTQEWLDAWLQGARWSSRDSREVMLGPLR
ncbi:MAG: helix-turn-helix transcriptional regulator [Candidatus Krumholzibacteriia bacterium]